MKILVDLSYLNKNKITGVSVFAVRLLYAIQRTHCNIEFLFVTSKNSHEYVQDLFPDSIIYDGVNLPVGSNPLNFVYQKIMKG